MVDLDVEPCADTIVRRRIRVVLMGTEAIDDAGGVLGGERILGQEVLRHRIEARLRNDVPGSGVRTQVVPSWRVVRGS